VNIPTHDQSIERCIVAGTPSEWLLHCCCSYSPSAFTTPLNEHTLANPYFRVHTANISLRHWDSCSTIWLAPPKFRWSI